MASSPRAPRPSNSAASSSNSSRSEPTPTPSTSRPPEARALLGGEWGAVGDVVLRPLGSAGAVRRVARERVRARPRATVDGVGPALGEEPRRSEQVDGELGERLRQVAPLQLGERDLGPVLLALDDLRERPVVEQLRVLDVRARPGDPLADLGIGPEEEEPPVGEVGGRDPDLLSVDDVLVAVADRGGAQVGEVGAGFGLAEPLAPVLRRVEDAGQPLLLLLVGAPLDDHGADLPDAVGVVDARRAHARVLFGVDDVLDRSRLAPAPVLRPVDRCPASLVQPALPVLASLLAAGDARRSAAGAPAALILVTAPVGEELRQVLLEPRPELVAEPDVVRGGGEI